MFFHVQGQLLVRTMLRILTVCVCVCVCVYTLVFVQVSIGVCIRRLRTCILPNLQLAQGVIHTHNHTHTHIRTYTHTCTYAHTYTHTCTYAHTYTHTCTYAHTYTHIHTHTGMDRRLLEKVVGQHTCAALSHGEMNGHESRSVIFWISLICSTFHRECMVLLQTWLLIDYLMELQLLLPTITTLNNDQMQAISKFVPCTVQNSMKI